MSTLAQAHALLTHYDATQLWPTPTEFSVKQAYATALELRRLRIARGEQPRGYKIGFTNRSIWPRYNVAGPIWGTVYGSTLVHCEGRAEVSLQGICQPRLEPEAVFGLRAAPPANASLNQLFDCLDWVAPGFEIVQSHLPGWKFAAPDAIADGALHARLIVGTRVPVRSIASNSAALCEALAASSVRLSQDGVHKESGKGSAVLGDPLHALHHFLQELTQCPGAPTLQAGDVITTGTWTDAWPIAAGQLWEAGFSAPLNRLTMRFTAD